MTNSATANAIQFRGHRNGQRRDCGHDDPEGRHARGAEPADSDAGEEAGQQRADRISGQCGSEDGVAQAEVGLELRVSRDDVEEYGAVGKEKSGNGDAGEACLPGGCAGRGDGEGGRSGHRLPFR
jgi:hypothetical protein